MRAALLPTSLVFSWLAASAASPAPKQVFEYLKPVLEHETNAAGDIWASSGNGGYVFRFDLDVSGDGLPEMFITSSLEFQNQSGTWRAYRAQRNGDYVPYNYAGGVGGLHMFGTELLVEQVGAAKSILTFGSDRGKNYVGRYSFQDTQVSFERNEVDAATFNQLKSSPSVKRIVPEVQGVLLVDLLRNPNAEWKRIDFERNAPDPNGYFIAAEDAERVKGLVNFTPDLALRWHASAAAGKTPVDASSVAIPQPAPVPSPTPAVPPAVSPSPTTPVAQTPAPASDQKTPVWPWLVGILALVVIVAIALKRRA